MSGAGRGGPDGPAAVEVRLALHVDFYPPGAVERTVAAFAEVADCRVERAGDHLHVFLRRRDGGPAERTRLQFANYALVASAAERSGAPPA